jgi:hypothetical protein
MTPITLPQGYRRSVLRSFWASISIWAGVSTASLAFGLGWPAPLAWGVAGAAIVGTLVFSHEHVVRRLHGAWNNRVVRPVARWCVQYLLRLCFFVVFVAAGRAGSRMILAAGDPGGWTARQRAADRDASPLDVGASAARGGWMRSYVRWAAHSGNAWSISLLPLLLLIRLLAAEQESAATPSIYTLF